MVGGDVRYVLAQRLSPIANVGPGGRGRLDAIGYDGDLISRENSFKHWADTLKKKSVGVLAVIVEECNFIRLPAASSPLENFDSHAHIVFTAYGKKDQSTRTKALLEFALAREWLFQPDA